MNYNKNENILDYRILIFSIFPALRKENLLLRLCCPTLLFNKIIEN